MFQSAQNLVPLEWRGTVELISTPVSWLPAWHVAMINFAWYGSSITEILFKRDLVRKTPRHFDLRARASTPAAEVSHL
jgi:hypothetical protein